MMMNNNEKIYTHIFIPELEEDVYVETNSGSTVHLLSTFSLVPDYTKDLGELGTFWYFKLNKKQQRTVLYGRKGDEPSQTSLPEPDPEQWSGESIGEHFEPSQGGEDS